MDSRDTDALFLDGNLNSKTKDLVKMLTKTRNKSTNTKKAATKMSKTKIIVNAMVFSSEKITP